MVATVLMVTPSSEDVTFYTVLLEEHGYVVVHAHSPAEAMRMALSRAPDVVVTELFEQTRNGFLTPDLLKANTATSEIPLIAVTAWAMPEQLQRAARAGFDVVLPKPVLPRNLIEIIQEMIPQDPRRARRSSK
jgi:two-component system cell cycle response regulator DivK